MKWQKQLSIGDPALCTYGILHIRSALQFKRHRQNALHASARIKTGPWGTPR